MSRCILVDKIVHQNTTMNCIGQESSRTLCTTMHNYARFCKSAKLCIMHNYPQLCTCIIFAHLQNGNSPISKPCGGMVSQGRSS